MPSLVEFGSVVLEKRIFFNFVSVFSLFSNYLPLEKSGTLHLYKFESPSPKDALCQIWVNLAQWSLRRNFSILSMYFQNFVTWKRAWAFIWTKLNPVHPMILCAKFGWIWLGGSGEEDFLILSMYNYHPLDKGGALLLNILESH